MEVVSGEEQERSRLEELAEEVMTKEQQARNKELEDIEKAGYSFEGTRLELVADEVIIPFLISPILENYNFPYSTLNRLRSRSCPCFTIEK